MTISRSCSYFELWTIFFLDPTSTHTHSIFLRVQIQNEMDAFSSSCYVSNCWIIIFSYLLSFSCLRLTIILGSILYISVVAFKTRLVLRSGEIYKYSWGYIFAIEFSHDGRRKTHCFRASTFTSDLRLLNCPLQQSIVSSSLCFYLEFYFTFGQFCLEPFAWRIRRRLKIFVRLPSIRSAEKECSNKYPSTTCVFLEGWWLHHFDQRMRCEGNAASAQNRRLGTLTHTLTWISII